MGAGSGQRRRRNSPPILAAEIAVTPLVGFVLLALGLYLLYKASK
jgi:hypothetical protein